jgi:hypothetical protein
MVLSILTLAPGAAHGGRRRSDMTEEPEPERTSVAAAGVRRIRTGLADAGNAATRTLERLRDGRKTPEMAEEPKAARTSIAAEVQRIRTGLADAGIAARRTLNRLGWARVIGVATVQLVIALIAWRISVRRDRRRKRRVQLWIDDVLKDSPRPRGGRRRMRRR